MDREETVYENVVGVADGDDPDHVDENVTRTVWINLDY